MNKDYDTYNISKTQTAHRACQSERACSVNKIGGLHGIGGSPDRKRKLEDTNIVGTRGSAHTRDCYDEANERNDAQRAYILAQVGAQINCLRPTFVALVNQIQQLIYEAMVVQGFWDGDQRNFGGKVALIHSELSEALEANRKGIEWDDKVPQYTGEEAEFADTLIRLLDSAAGFNMRLGEAVVDKMLFNLSRPHKHDKQY